MDESKKSVAATPASTTGAAPAEGARRNENGYMPAATKGGTRRNESGHTPQQKKRVMGQAARALVEVMRNGLALSTILPSIRRTAFLQCVSGLLGIEEGRSSRQRRPFFGLKKAVLPIDPLFFSHLYKTVSKSGKKLRRMSQKRGISQLSVKVKIFKAREKCKDYFSIKSFRCASSASPRLVAGERGGRPSPD